MNLKEKVVAITGGTVGVGKACVDTFLGEGCKVAICARSQTSWLNFVAYTGKDIFCLQADTSSQEQRGSLCRPDRRAFWRS